MQPALFLPVKKDCDSTRLPPASIAGSPFRFGFRTIAMAGEEFGLPWKRRPFTLSF
jgi:hypothetical protein